MGPGLVYQDVTKPNRFVEALCYRPPLKSGASTEMAPQVSHGDLDFNFGRDRDPVYVCQFFPRPTAGAEKAFKRPLKGLLKAF